jgi:uncharacterized protein (TIGR00290 family)
MRQGRKRVVVSWSSGKDSAWSLHELRRRGDVEVVALVTSFNQEFGRAAMHGVRKELVEAQARAAGLPLWSAWLPWPCTNAVYEQRMGEIWARARAEDVEAVAFGDLFLEDVRVYRERQMKEAGLEPLFPVWGRETGALAREIIGAGVKARLTCVDPKRLDGRFAGREFDLGLLDEMPEGVDACGENGEFHTFVWAGPMFEGEIGVKGGEVVAREGFVFADLIGF